MSISWVTVLAQIGNFLVLVWLLKRFLYKPILDGIDAREAEIASQMGEADVAQRKAATAEAGFLKQQKRLLADKAADEESAREQAEQEKAALLSSARNKMEQEKRDWHAHLLKERETFMTELHLASAETLFLLVCRALRDLAEKDLEEQMALYVVNKLKPLAQELIAAKGMAEKAIATTHMPLSDKTQKKMESALDALDLGIPLSFTIDEGQSPGLILRIGNAQVAWTIDSYTDELIRLLADRLAESDSGKAQNHG